MINFQKIWVALVLLICCQCTDKLIDLELQSPDGRILVNISLSDMGSPSYSVRKIDEQIITSSRLGLILKNDAAFGKNWRLANAMRRKVDEQWKPVWGTDSLVENNYNELVLELTNSEGHKMNIHFRVYDDGVGFRYEIPEQETLDSLIITDELTEFNVATNGTAWSIPANYESYEFLYSTSPVDSVESANTPITVKCETGTYLSIHEANLTNYAGMTLINKGNKNFECDLVPWPDGDKVKTTTPMKSPWRTVMIADKAGDLISSHLIQNLNEPSQIQDVSWIEPMKYVGIWWGMHIGAETWTLGPHHGATTENMIRFIDFAADRSIDAVLAEGWNTGWERWGQAGAFDQTTPYADYDFEYIAKYAKAKGVRLIGHHETGGDILTYEQRLNTAMRMLAAYDIHALKTGYAGPISNGYYHHSQRMVNHYRKVVEAAAKYQIMLDVHEPIKPTGTSRTWPNMMTREGVRGMEWNAWSEGNPPEHHVIIPFTRGLAGPIDYTPGIFDIAYKNRKRYVRWNSNDQGNSRVNTTLAKQLALWVTLYSPMQMASDQIDNYFDHPAFEFFEQLPARWTESKVLAAEIGDYLVMARRSGNSWLIGATTDEEERTLHISLDFLSPELSYEATIYADDELTELDQNPTAYRITSIDVDHQTELEIKMSAGGGQAIRIAPIKPE